jgi:UPF0755 protein
MTLGGGYKPRGESGKQSRPGQNKRVVVDQGWDDYIPPDPEEVEGHRRGSAYADRDYRSSGSGGVKRFLGFALFAVIIVGLVVAGLNFVARPMIVNGIVDWASGNTTALSLPFVPDIVRGALWADISQPLDPTDNHKLSLVISPGATPQSIGEQLVSAKIIKEPRAFLFESIEMGADQNFQLGRHEVSASMNMDEIIKALVSPPLPPPTVRITFREGLRIEQMVAKLEYLEANPIDPAWPLQMNVGQFYDLAEHPTADFMAQYPWLKLPPGASLEGFLFPATYNVAPNTTPSELLGMLVDAFVFHAPPGLLNEPPAQIYQTVQVAALVEMEAKVDSDRPLIAGVYTNRLNKKIWPTGLLNADPTLNSANDTVWLRSHPIETWVDYSFWESIKTPGLLSQVVFPDDLASYNTYHHSGLPTLPICSPSGPSLAAAMTPDTTDGYLYFLAKNDGTGTSAFAKTQAEQDANLKLYGYIK